MKATDSRKQSEAGGVQRDADTTGDQAQEHSNRAKTKLSSTLRRLEQKHEQRTAEVIQLPLWADSVRGTPNSFLRSALFSAVQSKDREYIDGVVLASQSGITVKYTGQQLNQQDLSLWETLVHQARLNPLGNVVTFTAHSLLKAMDAGTGGEDHRRLHAGIARLTACAVEITQDGKTYFGPLIKGGVKDDLTSHYTLELNKELIRLYGVTQWTALNWQQRQKLRRKPLAQALHGYFSSHRKPYPVKLETLQRLCGSRNSEPRDFKRRCRIALEELVQVGLLESFDIVGESVAVVRSSDATRQLSL